MTDLPGPTIYVLRHFNVNCVVIEKGAWVGVTSSRYVWGPEVKRYMRWKFDDMSETMVKVRCDVVSGWSLLQVLRKYDQWGHREKLRHKSCKQKELTQNPHFSNGCPTWPLEGFTCRGLKLMLSPKFPQLYYYTVSQWPSSWQELRGKLSTKLSEPWNTLQGSDRLNSLTCIKNFVLPFTPSIIVGAILIRMRWLKGYFICSCE